MPAKQLRNVKIGISLFIVSLGTVIIFLPFFWMATTAFKPEPEILTLPIKWIPSRITFQHFRSIFNYFPVFRYLSNSLYVASVCVTSSVFFSAMTGYGFAKFRLKGGEIIFLILLTGLMVPEIVRIIPLYILAITLGIQDTYLGIMLPNLLSIYGIFIMRQYITTVPTDLISAARIDGASELRIFFTILLPLLKPAISALIIIKFLFTWNTFLWPLVVVGSENKKVITVGLASFVGVYIEYVGQLMAMSLISIIPILVIFLIFQRQFVKGITLTGIKY